MRQQQQQQTQQSYEDQLDNYIPEIFYGVQPSLIPKVTTSVQTNNLRRSYYDFTELLQPPTKQKPTKLTKRRGRGLEQELEVFSRPGGQFDSEQKDQINQLYETKKILNDSNCEKSDQSKSRSRSTSVFNRKQKYQGQNSVKRFAGSEREYQLEVPYQLMNRSKSKARRPKQDDTRSLFDDPKLQRVRLHTQKQVLSAISGSLLQQESIQWSILTQHDKLPKQFYMPKQFNQSHGPQNVRAEDIKTEYDAFRLFFDDEVYKNILHHTHQYYHDQFKKEVYFYCTEQKPTRPKYENNFGVSDLEGFISIYLYFGIVKMRNIRDYWNLGKRCRANKTDEEEVNIKKYLDSKIRIYKQSSLDSKQSRSCINQNMTRVMTYDKYKILRRFLRFGPCRSETRDPIFKIRDLITLMNQKFQARYYPGEWICLDEGMIPFNGKASFKVFNPQKPTKWGVKEYVVTDGVQPYTLVLKLHDGVDDDEDEDNEKTELIKGKISNLVLLLMQEYEHKSHKVVMDNYYNSPQLHLALKARGIGALGTLRHNRTGLSQADIQGEHFNKIFQNERIFYVSHDKQMIIMYFLSVANHPVAFLTSFMPHDQTSTSIDLQSLQLRPRKEEIPQILTYYNKYKGGVDRRNGFCATMRRKGENEQKWWRSVFWRLVETSVINAFVIYKALYRDAYQKRTFQDFRVSLIIQLASRYKDTETENQVAQEFAWVKKKRWFQKQGHTIIQGIGKGICVQCRSNETHDFCQDCAIEANKAIFVCSKTFCRRFHRYSDFDMNKDLFDKNQKTKKVKKQEKKICNNSKYNQIKDLRNSTSELEKEKLHLMVKKNMQLQYINTLMQKIQANDTFNQTKNISDLEDQFKDYQKTYNSIPKAELDGDGVYGVAKEEFVVIEDCKQEEYKHKLDKLVKKYQRKNIKTEKIEQFQDSEVKDTVSLEKKSLNIQIEQEDVGNESISSFEFSPETDSD